MHRGFTKLFNTIVTSTIWQENDTTRIVWITMLAIADAEGIVSASIPGLASVANVHVDAARVAIKTLLDVDADSRTKDFEGRRIEEIDGGWRILNYLKYRRMLNEEERREYKARWIANKRRQTSTSSRQSRRKSTHADADAEAEADKEERGANGSRPRSVEDWLKELEADKTYQGINVRTEYGKMLNWCKVRRRKPTQRRFVNWLNQAEKPLPAQHSARADYKRNYMPETLPDISEEERARLRKSAAEEKAKLREKLSK